VRGQWRTGQSGRLRRWLAVCAAVVIRWATLLCAGVAALGPADEEGGLPGHQSPSERQRRRRRRLRLQAAAACAILLLLLLLLLLLSLHFNLLPYR
jgi:type VI protein secretion system component VasF